MYPASVIAYAFAQKGIIDKNPVTQMKLQKLVYFAHGLHLAEYNDPLVKELFEAWDYGPVIPSIYSDYKIYGSSPILNTSSLFLFNPIEKEKVESTSLNKKALEAINITWDALKDIDAVSLSAWTHKDGSPWCAHYKNGIIPNNEIKEYFKREFIKP